MQTERSTSQFKSPDLRFQTSMTMFGPLHLTVSGHCEGVDLGYEAGRAACQTMPMYPLEDCMQAFFKDSRYRPRVCTNKIIVQWQAMFVLGWASCYLEDKSTQRITNETG